MSDDVTNAKEANECERGQNRSLELHAITEQPNKPYVAWVETAWLASLRLLNGPLAVQEPSGNFKPFTTIPLQPYSQL